MPAPKELERLGGLLNITSDKSRPFLDRCSETKYLAVMDYNQATSLTVELARQTLRGANSALNNRTDCKRHLAILRSTVELGQLDAGLLQALEKLRSKYLEKVLRPAIRAYLEGEDSKVNEIETLYNDALRIEGLLGVVQFLKKIEPVL
ncbi:MAG: hypothetical protein ACFFBL_07800 [Promethearchaeota archaeon]